VGTVNNLFGKEKSIISGFRVGGTTAGFGVGGKSMKQALEEYYKEVKPSNAN
jgi:hypothetical protein